MASPAFFSYFPSFFSVFSIRGNLSFAPSFVAERLRRRLFVVADLLSAIVGVVPYVCIHPIWFITDTSSFRLVCPLLIHYMDHATSLI